MAEILELTATSVGDILNHITQITRTWSPSVSTPEEVWFRGQAKQSYPLLPTFYRDAAQGIYYDEEGLFERFKALAASFTDREPQDDWDWYFLARHHGMPSRLLDWTESALAAVFFALEETMLYFTTRIEWEAQLELGKQPSIFDDNCPALWVMDAGTLNKSTCSPGDDYPFSVGGALTAQYLPAALAANPSETNRLPVALFPRRANTRIVAQQGGFTLHGHSSEPIESIAQSSSSPCEVRLARIVIDRANAAFLYEELARAGVNRVGLFPDLDTVAAHVRWVAQSKTPT